MRVLMTVLSDMSSRFAMRLSLLLAALVVSMLLAAPAGATDSSLPRSANPVWIEMDGAPWQIGITIHGGTEKYLVLDKAGRLAQLPEEDLRKLAALYEMKQTGYLKVEKLPFLVEFQAAMHDVEEKNYLVGVLARLQKELINLGVVGTAAFFSGGAVVVNKLSNVLTDEAKSLLWDAPKTVAKGWARCQLRIGLSETDSLVNALDAMSTRSLGTSAEQPVPMDMVAEMYAQAVFVDTYTLPAAELARALQPDSSAAKQFERLGYVAIDSTAEVLMTPEKKAALDALLNTYGLLQALSESVAEVGAYKALVEERRTHWAASRGGSGETIEGAPAYRDALFYNEPAALAAAGIASSAQTIIAIVDCSGSMRETDPGNLRRAALDMMIESLGPEVSLGIVAFESDATVLAEPVVLGSYGSASREKLLRSTRRVQGKGGTAILKGLNLAAQRCGRSGPSTCILLTDGRDSGWHGEPGNLPPGAVVHTIALSDKADRTGLAKLSAATGGVSEVARSGGDLQRIFGSLFARTVGDEVLALEEGTITTGETRSFEVRVEPGQGVLEGRLSWPGSDVDLSFISPSGRVYDIIDAVRGGYGTERDTYDIIRIKSPEPGIWMAVAEGVQLAPGGEPFTLQAIARESSLRTSWSLNIPVPEVGESAVLNLDTEGPAVQWREAECWLWPPDGAQAHERRSLGGVESLLSGSGDRRVWSMRMAVPGVYRLKVRVTGESGGLEVARMHDTTFRVVERGDGVRRTKEIDPFIRRIQ